MYFEYICWKFAGSCKHPISECAGTRAERALSCSWTQKFRHASCISSLCVTIFSRKPEATSFGRNVDGCMLCGSSHHAQVFSRPNYYEYRLLVYGITSGGHGVVIIQCLPLKEGLAARSIPLQQSWSSAAADTSQIFIPVHSVMSSVQSWRRCRRLISNVYKVRQKKVDP